MRDIDLNQLPEEAKGPASSDQSRSLSDQHREISTGREEHNKITDFTRHFAQHSYDHRVPGEPSQWQGGESSALRPWRPQQSQEAHRTVENTPSSAFHRWEALPLQQSQHRRDLHQDRQEQRWLGEASRSQQPDQYLHHLSVGFHAFVQTISQSVNGLWGYQTSRSREERQLPTARRANRCEQLSPTSQFYRRFGEYAKLS